MKIGDYLKFAGLGLLALIFFLLWFLQPERQLENSQNRFLNAVQGKNWEAAGEMMAQDYLDQWEYDKARALEDSQVAFSQFVLLKVERKIVSADVSGHLGKASALIKLNGRGGPFAELITTRINGLREPFVFHWRQENWKPWSWKLTRIEHPEMTELSVNL